MNRFIKRELVQPIKILGCKIFPLTLNYPLFQLKLLEIAIIFSVQR